MKSGTKLKTQGEDILYKKKLFLSIETVEHETN